MKSHIVNHNYYLESLEEIKKFPKDRKPTILLHDCCGPCACFPLLFLCKHFDVTLYYTNSNINTKEEFDKRLNEVKRLMGYLKETWNYDVKLIVSPYNHEEYMKDLLPFSSLPECGYRCQLCYRKRMDEAFSYADANNFDYVATVMTISRQKSSKVINDIAKELSSHHKTKYFFSDFKKNGGIDKGVELRDQIGLYCQNYCGCEFSVRKDK